jgi:acyl carrier protein
MVADIMPARDEPNTEAILAAVTRIARSAFQDPLLELRYETTCDDVPDWDSMNHITLVVGIEGHFDIQFPMAEIEELKSVGELVQAIENKLSVVHS